MAELVDAHDSNSCSARSVGSIPTSGTKNKRAAPQGGFFHARKKTEHKAKRLRKGKIKLPSLLEEIGRSTVEERRQSLQGSVFEEESNPKNLPLSFLGVLLIY